MISEYYFFLFIYIMAKHRSHKRKSHSKKSRTMYQQGGELAGNPASAWGWGLGTVGNGWTQFMNSLTLQPGQNLAAMQSNVTVPVGNLNAQTSQGNIGPNMKGDIPGQAGGKRRRHGRRSLKRGGNVGSVLYQAAVPGALVLMNHSLGKRSRKNRR
jgi:hypothetical protein